MKPSSIKTSLDSILGPFPVKAEIVISEATKFLTRCCLVVRFSSVMTMPRDVFKALESNFRQDCSRLEDIRSEMEKLRGSYNRFIELRQEMENRHSRVLRIIGLLGTEGIEIAKSNDREDVIDTAIGGQFNVKQLRENLPLWQALQEYLRVVSKASVEEIRAFLEKVGMEDVSRQAIESAVRAHPRVFQTIKKGKERYFSLREIAP